MNIFDTVFPPNPVDNGTAFYTAGVPKYMSSSLRRPGNFTGNHLPSCTAKQAKKFEVMGRSKKRHIQFLMALSEINRKAGGEERARRRAMARSLAKRMRKEEQEKKQNIS